MYPVRHILEPVARNKLLSELKRQKLIKRTSKGDNEIYSFVMRDAPSLMYETTRFREVSYRADGCGSGNIIDIDDFDVEPKPYRQLIIWNPREQLIVGGYRYAICSEYIHCLCKLSMTHYFNFSRKFVTEKLPYCIELGKAWVNPDYQPKTGSGESIISLDNLWDGIGAILNENKEIRHLYGKLTIPENYNPYARILLQWLLTHYSMDKENYLIPEKPIIIPDNLTIAGIRLLGDCFEDDFNSILEYLKAKGVRVPPFVTAYSELAKNIITFGTTINSEHNNSYAMGLLVNVKDVHMEKYSSCHVARNQNEFVYR
jgi:hypothetical protein